MNLLLHGIGGESDIADLPVVTKDALAGKRGEYDLVLANPPFGKSRAETPGRRGPNPGLLRASARDFFRLSRVTA